MLIMLMRTLTLLLSCLSVCADYSIGQSTISSTAEFHAYEDAWSISFDNVRDIDFHVLFIQICSSRSECLGHAGADETASSIVTCDALTHTLNSSVWHNQYLQQIMRSPAQSETFCSQLRTQADAVQVHADEILRDNEQRLLLRVRQPLSLMLLNIEGMLSTWAPPDPAFPDFAYTLTVRLTRVLVLAEQFAIYQSILTINMHKPQQSFFTFGVQNPCTAIGYAAPERGAVQLQTHNGDQRCVLTCRIDTLRLPFNAAPPTRSQLNATHPDYNALPTKYQCAVIPSSWATVFFAFSLETNMLLGQGYTQVFFDGIDRLAKTVQDSLASTISTTIVLGVSDTIYYQQSFQAQLRNMATVTCALTQCENSFYPSEEGWVNSQYLFARRRLLRTMQIHSLRVDGVLLTDDMRLLTNSSFRVYVLDSLRRLIETHASSLEVSDNSLQVVDIEQVDIERVLGFASPAALYVPPPPVPATPTGNVSTPSSIWSIVDGKVQSAEDAYTLWLLAGILAVIVLSLCFVACVTARNYKKQRRDAGNTYRAATLAT
jgi:hypothetical protein